MPVIATRHCDILDTVLDGKTGLLTAERDVANLAQAIARFYQMDVAEYEAFAAATRSHIEERFNVKTNARKLGTLYHELSAG